MSPELAVVLFIAIVVVLYLVTVGAGLSVWAIASRLFNRRRSFDNATGEALEQMDLAALEDMPEQDEEGGKTAADFLIWAEEIAQDGRIAKHLRRMERRSP